MSQTDAEKALQEAREQSARKAEEEARKATPAAQVEAGLREARHMRNTARIKY